MSVCGQNAVFFGHTYSKFGDSGIKPTPCEHQQHSVCNSMETQRTSSDLTLTANSHLSAMAEHHNRPFGGGHHGLNALPNMLDHHWPSPPLAHNHHMSSNNINANMNSGSSYNNTTTNSNNNNNNNNNNSSNNSNLLGSCIQNQCNISDMDTTLMDNNSSPVLKNGECSVITNDNHNNNNNNSTTNNKNNNNNGSSSNGNSSSSLSDGESPTARQNTVGTIVLHGVAIVSLIIDNKERLCLAQISNTLLKEYSYNEIHNRRVALGITCVQCTPVQLEILRRAGAMPVSSRRCGMITKREAERLVKSFLEDNDPPKLPDDFAFDVIHECGWGCRGLFEPARYNSSRAKCIKCIYCSMYFSPNKFIFHFHRTPGAKYNHPDAANFNSWRRHLKLNQVQDKDEITFKWEDVKAMFNGGTRKRIGSSTTSSSSSASPSSALSSSKLSSHLSSTPHHHHQHHHHSSSNSSNNINNNNNHHHPHPHHQTTTNRSASSYQPNSTLLDGASSAKKAKTSPMVEANSFLPKPAPFSNPFTPYGWLGAGTQSKTAAYPFMGMNSAQSMCFGFPPHIPSTATNSKDALMDRMKSNPVGVGNAPAWMNRNPVLPFQLASMDLLWDKTFGFPSAAAVAALGGFRNGSYPPSIFPGTNSHMGMDMNEHLSPPRDNTPCMSPNPSMPQNLMSPGIHERGEKGGGNRTSAFTRVVPSMSPPSSASLSPQNSNIDRNTPSRNGDEEDDDDVNDNDNDDNIHNDDVIGNSQDRECNKMDAGINSHRDVDDSEEIDVEDHSEDKKRLKCNNNNNVNNNNNDNDNNNSTSSLTAHQNRDIICTSQSCSTPQTLPVSLHSFSQHRLADKSLHNLYPARRSTNVSPITDVTRQQLSLPSSPRSDDENVHCHDRSNGRESVLSCVSESGKSIQSGVRDITKEECFGGDVKSEHGDMKEDDDMNNMKDQLVADGVSREQSFQEHMSKQLEMLRETLTTELEQERKIRHSLQEKLKQAHEALNSFSCGLLTPNGDANSNHFKDSNALPR